MNDNNSINTIIRIGCPYQIIGCNEDGRTMPTLVEHLQSEALAHSQLLIDSINHLTNDLHHVRQIVEANTEEMKVQRRQIEMSKEEIERSQELILNLRETIDKHDLEIHTLKRESENREIILRDIMSENAMLKDELMLVQQYDAKRLCDLGEMKEDVTELDNKLSSLASEFITAKGEIGRIKDFADLREAVERHSSDIDYVKKDTSTCGEELEKVRLQMKTLILDAHYDFVWTIDNFSKRTKWFQSDGFYKDNYRLCLRGWIGGFMGAYLKLYFCVMKSDGDSQAMWPMRHSVTVVIINQSTDQGQVSWRCQYGVDNDDDAIFGRPTNHINQCVGGPWMYVKDIRNTHGLLINDSVKVCCIMHPPAIG